MSPIIKTRDAHRLGMLIDLTSCKLKTKRDYRDMGFYVHTILITSQEVNQITKDEFREMFSDLFQIMKYRSADVTLNAEFQQGWNDSVNSHIAKDGNHNGHGPAIKRHYARNFHGNKNAHLMDQYRGKK